MVELGAEQSCRAWGLLRLHIHHSHQHRQHHQPDQPNVDLTPFSSGFCTFSQSCLTLELFSYQCITTLTALPQPVILPLLCLTVLSNVVPRFCTMSGLGSCARDLWRAGGLQRWQVMCWRGQGEIRFRYYDH